ncbi:MAG: hypothetical protein II137_02425 [Anaerovibrio sp.]|nr:hypothetical protein [Anaerovibrio sp.]
MQIAYGFDINEVKYLVMDVNEALMNSESVRRMAAYKTGIGADRVLFMDMVNNTVIAIFSATGRNIVPDINDFQAAKAVVDNGPQREYHLTDYYLSTIMAEKEVMKTAC